MFLRATLVAGATAALVALTGGGTAHASCLDDFQANIDDGYAPSPKSPYWWPAYVHQSGPLTVTVYGDALVSDHTSYVGDQANYVQVVAGNAPDETTRFVDCVAG